MSDVGSAPRRGPRWLPWVALSLLVLPFHPLWVDHEQVRRGLLLLLAGATLLGYGRLPHCRGERMAIVFVLALVLCALVQVAVQAVFRADDAVFSFQPWDAAYRIAHFVALLVIVRLGAVTEPGAAALPIASLLLATSAFGLLQRLGLAEIGGYGVEREPVSTLGNLNVASEWTAVSGVAAAVLLPSLRPRWRWLSLAALVLGAAYLVCNHSRSGMVALPVALVLLAIMRRHRRGWLPLLLALAGGALGAAIDAVADRPELDSMALQQERKRSTSTLEVRFEIARGAGQLFAESPVFGKGPGQFAVEYPRHRSQREIELSSFGRQFSVEVRSAHDDWVELLVDGGLPALVLFSVMLFALQRGTRDKTRLLPLFALLLLMLVRSPLGNAPAAAVAFWLVGCPAEARQLSPWRVRFRHVLAISIGLLLVGLGVLPVAGNTVFVDYQRARRDGEPAPIEAARAAHAWMPFEPRWLQILYAEGLADGDLDHAERYALKARALRPFSPPFLIAHGEVLARSRHYGEAIRVARLGLKLDPANPELRVLSSVAYAELGDVDRAIEAVVIAPHAQLRARLERHFYDLAQRAQQRGEDKQAKRLLIEHMFVAAADRLGGDSEERALEVRELRTRLARTIKELDRQSVDARFLIIGAIEALDLDSPELCERYRKAAAASPARLLPWQAALLGEQLDRLRQQPGWNDLLPPE